jgi:hypothetical protein
MSDIELVIKIPEEKLNIIKNSIYDPDIYKAIANGTPLPKGHGRIVDIGKIDEDKIESDNPIIYLTVNGEYIEAVSLDYLNNLPTIIEADKEHEE